MKVKGIVDEDFINYKKPSMVIMCHSCTFKCDKECGKQVCQNGTLATAPDIEIEIDDLINRYLKNTITHAVVFGGLEPFDDIYNVLHFISDLRSKYHNHDDVIIYTGYTKEEINEKFHDEYYALSFFGTIGNIYIKYGRFVPNKPKRYSNVLGVTLGSDNQYAEKVLF